ncbi:MAG: glycosyltransferase family 1 protein [Gemmataceae bacterium]|nr:glycosyltransferase family 4 protein [Gemmata sp.]MDW8199514.1 glycosyltransferase family 1 protein [Gemmataceae bacterium]
MRVLFNGITLLKPRTGIAHAAAHLHAALVAAYPADTFWLYPGTTVSRIASHFFRPSGPTAASSRPTPKAPHHPRRWRQLLHAATQTAYAAHFHTIARCGSFDLYHEPNFVPFRTHLPVVVTVFDLSVLLFPQWHPAERVKAHEAAYHQRLAFADHVLVGTETVRAEVQKYLGVAAERVTAMFCGVDRRFRPQPAEAIAAVRAKYQLPPRYLLYVGTIEPRKNVGLLLRVFCSLPAVQQRACPLVLAGGWGWKTDTERELFDTQARHCGARHIGYVPDADLPALYSGAAALLYPSFYEGFGMPPLEAMACGTVAVTSTAAAVREVVGSHALTIDPHDEAAWRHVLGRIATEPDFLADYRRRGFTHAATFTWEACAQRVYRVYRRVLGQSEATPPRYAA